MTAERREMSDEAIDALLVLGAGGPPDASKCIDEAAIDDIAWASYERARADDATRARVEAHLADCAFCRKRMVVRPAKRLPRWLWGVPIAAGLAAASLMLVPAKTPPDYAVTRILGGIASDRADEGDALVFDASSRIVVTVAPARPTEELPTVALMSPDESGRLRPASDQDARPIGADGAVEVTTSGRALFGDQPSKTSLVVFVGRGAADVVAGRTLDEARREHRDARFIERPCEYRGVPP